MTVALASAITTIRLSIRGRQESMPQLVSATGSCGSDQRLTMSLKVETRSIAQNTRQARLFRSNRPRNRNQSGAARPGARQPGGRRASPSRHDQLQLRAA
jgi:hypothetical protein